MSYKAKIRPLQLSSMKPDDAIRAIVAWINDDAKKEFISVEKGIFQTTAQQEAVITAVVPPPSGGSTTNITVSASVQVATVVQGAQTITFSPAQTLANWKMLICDLYVTNGGVADLKSEVSNQTVNTFDIVSPEAGTLFFSPAPRA